MRRFAAGVAAMLLALAPTAASAAPHACADPCTVQITEATYALPVLEIGSGTTVTWVASSESHPTSDSLSSSIRCYLAAAGAGVTPVGVRFDIVGGGVVATGPGNRDEKPTRCTSATALGSSGAFAMTFNCLLHPYMHGVMVVDPA